MRFNWFKKGILLLGGLLTVLMVGLGGCATSPPDRPDREKIKQDADKGMQDLGREEGRHDKTGDY
jgi:hypothetical protein